MAGKSNDPKLTRITVRISDRDRRELQSEARRRNTTIGAVIRLLIRDGIKQLAPSSSPSRGS